MTINGARKETLPHTNQRAAIDEIHSQFLSEMLTILHGLISSVGDAINRLQVHESHMTELHTMANIMLSKLVIIETKLDKPTKAYDSDLSQSPGPRSKRCGTPILKQKHAAKSPFNRSKYSLEDNVDNIILITSDDDTNNKVDNNIKHSFMPNLTSKMKHKLSPIRNQATTSKKLSFTPLPRATKSRRLPFTSLSNERKLKVPKLETKEDKIISKFVETNFVTTQDMKLQPIEEHVSYYVFHAKNDPSEELFKIETLTCLRNNFQTLCSGRIIDTEIIHIMSLKTTWIERNVAFPSIWSLPPSFVRDVYRGTTIEDMVSKYAKNWMPHFENLKHIYLPIEDCVGNWFLMVASVQDQILYHLDPGFEKRTIIPRQETIKELWQVITQMVQIMVQTNYFPPNFLFEAQHLDNWDMAEPVGLVSEGFCQHSAVWVLQWLAMGSSFTPNLHVMMNEDVVRMKVAIDLLLGDHNEHKEILMDKAEKAWHTE